MVNAAVYSNPNPVSYGIERSHTSVESLVLRLEEGERRILEAREAGEDTTKMELFWIQLLRQYEAAYDEMLQAA